MGGMHSLPRYLTGDRPTGRLHLGHYIGSLRRRVELQDAYDTFIMVADVQALTDNFDDPEKIRRNVHEVVLDNLAVGINPDKVTYFIQSQISAIAELTIYFMNLVTVSRLERNPTVKDEIRQKGLESSVPTGFFCYPISQAADILAFKAAIVPAGADQAPMVELTREVAERFNAIYNPVFPLPELVTGSVGRLVGTDGNAKMGKSLGNVINLSDSPEAVEKMVMGMYTDPNRVHPTDPGRVDGNPLFIYLDAFGSAQHADQIAEFKTRYQAGTVGDVVVKRYLIEVLNQFLAPIRARRDEFARQPELIEALLRKGCDRANDVANTTLAEAKRAMHLDYFA